MMPTPMTAVMAMITRTSVPMKNLERDQQAEHHADRHRTAGAV